VSPGAVGGVEKVLRRSKLARAIVLLFLFRAGPGLRLLLLLDHRPRWLIRYTEVDLRHLYEGVPPLLVRNCASRCQTRFRKTPILV
jgi:hypothetical protein